MITTLQVVEILVMPNATSTSNVKGSIEVSLVRHKASTADGEDSLLIHISATEGAGEIIIEESFSFSREAKKLLLCWCCDCTNLCAKLAAEHCGLKWKPDQEDGAFAYDYENQMDFSSQYTLLPCSAVIDAFAYRTANRKFCASTQAVTQWIKPEEDVKCCCSCSCCSCCFFCYCKDLCARLRCSICCLCLFLWPFCCRLMADGEDNATTFHASEEHTIGISIPENTSVDKEMEGANWHLEKTGADTI